MKVKLIDRFLLAVYALIGIVLAAAIGALLYFRNSFVLNIAGYPVTIEDNNISIAIMIALIVILIAWSIRIIGLSFKHEPKVDKTSVSVQNTENGSVRVSVQAMDMLVKQAIGKVDGVVEIKTTIINHEDSITVKVEMTLDSDVHIPNVTLIMQRQIKSFIEEYSGIAVREVAILVSKIIEVQSQPPLQIPEQLKREPEMIDQPAALEPEFEQPVSEPTTFEPEQVFAEPYEPEAEDVQPEPIIDAEADEIEADQPQAGESEPDEKQKDADEQISEKDFW